MEIERLSEQFIPQVADIERATFDEAWSEEMVRSEASLSTFIVGVEDDEVIAYASYRRVVDEAHVNNVAVREDHRRLGFGRQIVKSMIELAKSEGLCHMTLEVSSLNVAAIKLYQSFGFKIEGARKKYYSDGADALLMWLHFGRESESTP